MYNAQLQIHNLKLWVHKHCQIDFIFPIPISLFFFFLQNNSSPILKTEQPAIEEVCCIVMLYLELSSEINFME